MLNKTIIRIFRKLIFFIDIAIFISKYYNSCIIYQINHMFKNIKDIILNAIDDIVLIRFFLFYWTADADHGK